MVNDDKGMSAPAGSLVFSDNEHIVTMTDFSMSLIGDEVKAFEAFPGEGADSQLNFSLNVSVIPEPSVSLLALLGAGLFFRRRR